MLMGYSPLRFKKRFCPGRIGLVPL